MGQAREGARHQDGVAAIARFVVPFGPGGAADRAARTFAAHLAAAGISLAIENIPGAGSLEGVRRANALARSGAAVLLLGTPSTHVLLAARDAGAPDPAFVALAGLGSAPNVLLAAGALRVASVQALIGRARRERLTYASAGTGQTIHLASAWFCALAGIAMDHRSFDAGSASAYAELASGRVHVYFDSVLACREAIAQGLVVPLAVSDAERSPLLPSVPTLAECGFPRHALDVWFAVFGAHLEPAARSRIAARVHDRALVAALGALGLTGGVLPASVLETRVADSAGPWREALAAA